MSRIANTPSGAEVASHGEQSDLLELQPTSQPCVLTKVSSEVRIADAERVKNFRRAVTTSVQEASHWEMISQRNNGAPSRIPNRISPGWFTWQTVALLLCSWILTHTMP